MQTPALDNISISSLRNFIVIADLGNITSASEELFITQPTLSRQIAALEDQLGVQLFKRVKSGVELTEAGRKFYGHAQTLIQAFDDFISQAYYFRSVISGTLKMAHQKSGQELVIAMNRQFLSTYPNVTIRNMEQSGINLLEELRAGTFHVVFIYGHEKGAAYKDLESLPLGNMYNMLLVARDNPLSKRESVSLEELREQQFIVPSRFISPYRNREILESCRSAGYSPNVVSNADSLLEIISDVVRYSGVSILPYIHNVEGGGQVRYVKLTDYKAQYPIIMVWRPDEDNPVLNTYVDFVKARVGDQTDTFLYTPEEQRILL
ncbi:MAG: LysR family transcriptional regulator [Firmicutes bacterium]|nr:LysR family transcriptional regulator [Bacillota bacterium]